MFCISINDKCTPLTVREPFSFTEDKQVAFLAALKDAGIPQAVFLTTCNRTEVYGVGDAYTALEILCRFANADSTVKNHVLIFDGARAVHHLFHVACGLESMVLGEDEILGQVKRAYAFSCGNGFAGYEIHTVFQAAIGGGKKIKTETMLSKSSVSVATLAASCCHKFRDRKKTVLLIGGSGEIGSKVLKNLLSYHDFEIYAAKRDGKTAADGITVVPYAQRYAYANRADIIISATKSPHFTVTLDKLRLAVTDEKPRLILDLAVPRDVDSAVKDLNGVTLFTVDDFKTLAEQNNAVKQTAVQNAEELMETEIDALLKELAFHDFLPELQKIQNSAVQQFIYRFRDAANAEELKSFLRVLSKTEVQT